MAKQGKNEPHVSSAVGSAYPPVPQTRTPRAAAAPTSTAAFAIPVVTIRRNPGSSASNASSIPVRSRIKTTTSARDVTGDQSADERATPW